MIYWKNADFTKLSESRSIRDRKSVAELVGAFDTETSTVEYDNVKYAFMYVWQFAVNDIAVYGRTWDDLKEFLLNLKADLHLSSEYKLVVYVHNLKYDFQFFKNQLNLDGDFLARDSRTIIKATIQDCFEFRDSGCYTETSLESMGNEIGFEKLSGADFDYSKIRHHETPLTPEELKYCEHDVLILTKYFRREAEIYRSVKNIPITATRRVKRLITAEMKKYGKQMIAMMAGRQLKTDLNPEKHNSAFIENHKNDDKILTTLRKSFFGGFTYSNVYYRNCKVSDITGIDISSSYPTQALLHKFPMGKFKPLKTPQSLDDLKTNKIYKGKALLITFSVDSLDSKYPGIGFLPVYHKNYWSSSRLDRKNLKSNKMLHAKYTELTLTDVDFKLFLRYYDYKELKILGVIGSEYAPLPDYIIKVIIDLYQKKAELKMRNEKIKKARPLTFVELAEYERVKSMLNRVYGIFVQDPVKDTYSYKKEEKKVKSVGQTISEKFDGVLYQWGVWIVAWARYELLNIFDAIGIENKKYKNNILHCDTDSIYFRGDGTEVIERYNQYTRDRVKKFCFTKKISFDLLKGIGELTTEQYQEFKTLGLKQYAYISNDRFDYHSAGLPRPDYKTLTTKIVNVGMNYFDMFKTNEAKMDAFNSSMYIPKENAKVHRNTYVDEPLTDGEKEIWTDGLWVKDHLGNIAKVEIDSYLVIDFEDYDPTRQEELADMLEINEERFKFIAERFL